jgi:hypothetical protein
MAVRINVCFGGSALNSTYLSRILKVLVSSLTSMFPAHGTELLISSQNFSIHSSEHICKLCVTLAYTDIESVAVSMPRFIRTV